MKPPPEARADEIDALRAVCADLQAQLDEAEATLAAIRSGEVDALVVGDHVYTLDSANAANNLLRKDVLAQMEDAVVAFDRDDHVIYMNAAAERQYGRTASQALGHARADLFEESWRDGAAEAASRAALDQRGSSRTQSIHQRRDGSRVHVESTLSRLHDAGGQARGVLAVIRDISERVRSEQTLRAASQALARREREFSTLVENSPDILTRFDRQLRHRYVNSSIERYTGLAPRHFLGRTHAELGMPAALCERWRIDLERVFETGAVGRSRFRFDSVDGTEAVFEARLVPEFGSDGAVESVLSIAADVTEQEAVDAARRVAEASLRDADRRKDEFLATLAHELRNPLAPIRNAIGIMRLTADPALHADAHAVIERQLLQMVHLVDDLLDVGRISQGKVELRLERVDVAAAVHAAIETSRPLIAAGRHELAVHLPAASTLMVDADPTRLTQVIANLLNNAAKYTPEGGRIEVRAEAEGPNARISVADSGVGIPPRLLPQVFDMFAQINRTLSRAQGGLGIGLALVKQLVELHGGSVEASSAGEGCGSTFVVRVPRSAPAQRDTPARSDGPAVAAAPPDPAAGDERRVLVVDDNVDSAESLSKVLQLLGYTTRIAFDGQEALRIAAEFRPRAALLDIGLPMLSGHEVATRLRQRERAGEIMSNDAEGGNLPLMLIAISGWGQEEDRRRSAAAGFDHHFVKPVDIPGLLGILAGIGQQA